MKTRIITIVAAAIALQIGSTSASDISIERGSYRFSGRSATFSSANSSPMYRSGMGYGQYQYGSVTATVANKSYNRSGTIVLNLWISSYVGATSGKVVYSNGWGANSGYVFGGGQSWTCTKPGYRKIVNRYGYASLGAHEYSGGTSWPMRDEMYFNSSYGKW
jgi:hypothetical protein